MLETTVLMFHDIRNNNENFFPKRYSLPSYISIARFRSQIEYILSCADIIDFDSLINNTERYRKAKRKTVILTFDDGLKDHVENVLPILKEYGVSGTFLVPGRPVTEHRMIDSHKIQFILASGEERVIVKYIEAIINSWNTQKIWMETFGHLWQEYSRSLHPDNWWSPEMIFVTRLLRRGLNEELRTKILDKLFREFVPYEETKLSQQIYLTTQDVIKLYSEDMCIGSHGWSSEDISLMSYVKQSEDVKQSFNYLDKHGVLSNRIFSYPNGKYDQNSIKILKKENVLFACTVEKRNYKYQNDSSLLIPRWDGAQDNLTKILE